MIAASKTPKSRPEREHCRRGRRARWLTFGCTATILLLILALDATAHAKPRSGWYDVRDFGAVSDGHTECTRAISKAMAEAGKHGGGTIYFSAGEFLTGPIHLKSHTTLYLDAGAVVKFSTNFEDYLPMVPSRYEGIEVTNFSPLIYAQDAADIAIMGRGTLDGQGAPWWQRWKSVKKNGTAQARDKYQLEFARLNPHPLVATNYKTLELGFLRPPFIQPRNCTNVLIQGVTIINSPFWTITPLYCENVTIRSVIVQNPLSSPNTDGIDPDSCRDVHISDCHISVGDDCITIKSGRDADGRRVGKPAENYVISNCTMGHGHGGVVIGSETSGGVKNITVANCIFEDTERGIRIKSARGRGGVIEDVRFSNVVMRHIRQEALVITAFYEPSAPEPVSERTPIFRNISISGITGDAKTAGAITGLTEMPLDGISLNDVKLNATTGIRVLDATNVAFHNVIINTDEGPAMAADRTSAFELDSCRTSSVHDNTPFIELGEVKNIFIHGCSVPPDMVEAVQMPVNDEKQVIMEGNHFGPAKVRMLEAGTSH